MAVILLLDDDQDFLEITRHMLNAAGHEAICCQDPAAALAALKQHKVELVITDLMMSSLDAGFSFAQQLKADPELGRLPVIIATSASSTGLDFHPRGPEDLSAMRAEAFFDKPLPAGPLLAKIQELLGRR